MKKPILIQAYVSDGSALYINGKLASNWFTCGEARLINSLGFKKWKSIKLCDRYYRDNDFPKLLKDCVIATK